MEYSLLDHFLWYFYQFLGWIGLLLVVSIFNYFYKKFKQMKQNKLHHDKKEKHHLKQKHIWKTIKNSSFMILSFIISMIVGPIIGFIMNFLTIHMGEGSPILEIITIAISVYFGYYILEKRFSVNKRLYKTILFVLYIIMIILTTLAGLSGGYIPEIQGYIAGGISLVGSIGITIYLYIFFLE